MSIVYVCVCVCVCVCRHLRLQLPLTDDSGTPENVVFHKVKYSSE
jgi:hypothetical protein